MSSSTLGGRLCTSRTLHPPPPRAPAKKIVVCPGQHINNFFRSGSVESGIVDRDEHVCACEESGGKAGLEEEVGS